MIVDFKLPELGENIESADIIKINVSVGDSIEVDQILFEIETDKATIEVPSENAGTVKEIMVKAGQKANVGDVVLKIDSKTETESKKAEPEVKEEKEKTPVVKVEEKTEEKIKEVVQSDEKSEKPSDIVDVPTTEPSKLPIKRRNLPDKIAPAAPSVRRFSREIGIDIQQVAGSGPGGRISEDDIKKFAKNLNENRGGPGIGSGTTSYQEPLPDFSKWGNVSREPMSNIRKKTAEHLSYAWNSVPHVTQFDKADITELEKLRKSYGKKAEALGGKLTITAILLKVTAAALKVFPNFNASVDMANKEIIFKDYYNVGIAADTDRGLLVPVIKDVDKKNILQLSVELTELSKKARDKKLSLDEMQGGNFTISNLGGIGGTAFTPVVNTPEVAILGVSRSTLEPVFFDGEFKPRLIMPLSLSYDHKIIDGADAARFLRWVCEALENPLLLALEG